MKFFYNSYLENGLVKVVEVWLQSPKHHRCFNCQYIGGGISQKEIGSLNSIPRHAKEVKFSELPLFIREDLKFTFGEQISGEEEDDEFSGYDIT